ncbi:MAG: cytochrome c [Burkholderiales bacterium]
MRDLNGRCAGMLPSLAVFAIGMTMACDAAAADAQLALGREVFTKLAVPPCGLCHTLQDAGTSGEIGAKLEELKPDSARVMEAVRKGLGVMPSYAGKLSEEQIRSVARYVARVTGGEP